MKILLNTMENYKAPISQLIWETALTRIQEWYAQKNEILEW